MTADQSAASARSPRILLVEDAADIREVFAMLLKSEGAEVVAASSAREAAAVAAREDFDLVLTDLGLPDLPGDVLIRGLLATARRRPRVIVLTGYGEPFTSRARRAGADIVLNKPIAWSTLLGHLSLGERAPASAAPDSIVA